MTLRTGASLLARVAALAFAWVATATATAPPDAVAVPPVARVTDLAGALTPEQSAALSAKLTRFEADKGSQIAVLIVATTAPEDIEQYGIRVADAWKLGRQGIDDGLILLIATQDRRMRFEVGRGLEGPVPDLLTHRIIEEVLQPAFRAHDYYGGIDRALDRVIGLVNGEPLPAPPEPRARRGSGGLGNILPIFLVIGLIGGPMLRAVFGRPVGAVATGGLAGLLGWALAHAESLLPLPAATFEIILALASDELHGYAIMKAVADRPGGGSRLGAGTLYGVLKRLLTARIVEEMERPDPDAGDERRRYYRLTRYGLGVARAEARRLGSVVREARRKRLIEKPA